MSDVDTKRNSSEISKPVSIVALVVAALPLPMFLYVLLFLLIDSAELLAEAQGDPKIVAGQVSQRLVPVVLSLVFGLVAFLVGTCSIAFGTYRAPWFIWALLVVAIIYSLAFPVGTVLALICGLVLFLKRAEIFPDRNSADSSIV